MLMLAIHMAMAQNGVRIYDYKNQWSSTNATLTPGTYSGSGIPNGLNDKASSIKIYPGYQVTFAENADGTGYSKTYISRVGQLNRNLSDFLNNKVSYIKVLPYRDVSKKGICGPASLAVATGSDWYYDWGTNGSSATQYEYVPQQWGKGSDPAAPNKVNGISDVTQLLMFNEPDNCNGQSGQYGDMCIVDTAVVAYEKMLKTGLRIGSPVTTESQVDNYLYDFMVGAQNAGYRLDFVAVHWYDWKGWGQDHNMNSDPNGVFNRFKNYINSVYAIYGLPIWVTEFNANPNRYTWVQKKFLELALPWLENQPFIERYAYYRCTGWCDFQDSTGALTPLGQVYKDHVSTLAIPEDYWDGPTLLEVTLNGNGGGGLRKVGALVSDVKEEKMFIYPNPVTSVLTVNGLKEDQLLEVINVNGKTVIQKRGQSVDVSALSNGIYFLKVQDKVMKFIK